MPRTSLKAATAAVAARDPVIAALVERVGPCRIPKRNFTPFEALARSIVYQQLAGKAAATIYGRFRALVPGDLEPDAVLRLPDEQLRGAGLSANKAASIRDLATKVIEGDVELDRLPRLSDDRIVEELTAVRGIGRWTAEMFLIFQLRRLDVWPVGDLGVQTGFSRAYGLDERPPPKTLMELGEPFRPYRTIVAWYCWRVVDTVVPEG
jgi:DNA-3-methyladenine glycosylase II